MSISYPCLAMSGNVHFVQCEDFKHVQNFPSNKDVHSMNCHCVAYTLHKPIALSVRDEFCHWITKFCNVCPFSLHNESIDQAFKDQIYQSGYGEMERFTLLSSLK